MIFLAIGWGALSGAIASAIIIAALEYHDGAMPGSRKRRLIEAGRLCECSHGSWQHADDGCCMDCTCVRFTPVPRTGPGVPDSRLIGARERLALQPVEGTDND